MKKISFALVILLVIAFTFTGIGCSKTSGEVIAGTSGETQTKASTETTKATETKSEEIIVLRFVSDETDIPSVEAYNKAIDQYEAEHPNIKIELELMGYDSLLPYYATNIAGGNAPDIGKGGEMITLENVAQGYLLELDDVIENMGGESEFFPNALLKFDGHVYNLPAIGGGPVLWVRKDLFEQYNVKIPTTWDEWLEAAKELTLDTDNDGNIDIYGTTVCAGKSLMAENLPAIFTHQQGQTFFDKDLNPTFNTEAFAVSLDMISKLAQYCPPGIGEYSFYEMMEPYGAEKTASTIYWGRLLGYLEANNPELLSKTVAVPMPMPENGIKSTHANYDSYFIFKDSKHPEAAKDFLEFLVTGDRIGEFMLTVPGHIVPGYKSAFESELFWNDPFVKENIDNIKACFEVPEYGLGMTFDPGATAQNGIMVSLEGVYNTVYPPIEAQLILAQSVQMKVLQNKDAKEITKWAQQEVERIISENK